MEYIQKYLADMEKYQVLFLQPFENKSTFFKYAKVEQNQARI